MLWILMMLNANSFFLMYIDKKRAMAHQWRISEKTLFLSAICFGSYGAWLGMTVFRHKTKHWKFKVFIPLLAVLQFVLLVKGYQDGLFLR